MSCGAIHYWGELISIASICVNGGNSEAEEDEWNLQPWEHRNSHEQRSWRFLLV